MLHILRGWAADYWKKLVAPQGWSHLTSAIMGVAAIAAGLITYQSYQTSIRQSQIQRFLDTVESTETRLVSSEASERMSAYRSLVSLASVPASSRHSLGEFEAEAWRYPRTGILRALQGAKIDANGGANWGTYGEEGQTPIERSELLKAFDEIGRRGWYEDSSKATLAARPFESKWIVDALSRPDREPGLAALDTALERFDFREMKIHKGNYSHLNLDSADFSGAAIDNANYERANLGNTVFQTTKIEHTRYTGADLRNSIFQDAIIAQSIISEKSVPSPEMVTMAGCRPTNSSSAVDGETNLSRASFFSSEISSSTLNGVNGKSSKFDDSNLSSVCFVFADLEGASFVGTNLGTVSFQGAKLVGADFSDAVLSGVDFTGADLTNAKFDKATFRDKSTIDSLSKASSLYLSNFNGAHGLSQSTYCNLFAQDAVQIEQHKLWASAGRPLDRMDEFMSADQRATLGGCFDGGAGQ